ncbi:related to MSL5-branch point bridging protein [Sporisorium reilianum SRZ2]|uniref:Branchpoint-bridging protein n=1 Tax=Sporisorium reilianum (strain SRZ2) TaxID=999809 RepID=E6ZWG5_SPORE|nr:related to MSL5-branch point bridging protein [Sporisorium reilianum SRZ2]
MSWRSNAQRTGMNAQPLQGARRWGGGGGGDGPNDAPSGYAPPSDNYQPPRPYQSSYHQQQQQPSHPYSAAPPSSSNPRDAALAAAAAVAASIRIKRDRDAAGPPSTSYAGASSSSSAALDTSGADGGPRKRKSRWGDANDKLTIPTAIGANVSAHELDKYAIQVRLDEISRKLRSGDFIPPDRERSPSPPPTYDNQGRRTNTREVRYRKKLEDERVALVDRQLKLDPNFRPPSDYHAIKRNQRPTEKVYLPIKEFPEINFFGLLVGPRGNTLKTMERQSGAKISIRGKGSVKDGKGKGGDEDEEEMHCVVAADDEAAVKKCIKLINQVIETAASTPEGENDHKRNQLRELAALNGTLRDDENQLCKNCGNKGHRAFECPEQRNWTAHIICHRCGGQGHLARDCTQGRGGSFGAGPSGPGAPAGGGTGNRQFDSEYASLMAELGEPAAAGAAAGGASAVDGANVPAVGADGKKIPPWRNPDVWTQPGFGGPRGADPGRGGWGRGGYSNRGDRPNGGYNAPHQPYPHPNQAYAGYDQSAPAPAGEQGAEAQQDYSAEWAAYYAAQAAAGEASAATATAAGGDGAAAGQVDYTKEWEEYYRMQAAAAAQDGSAYGAARAQ